MDLHTEEQISAQLSRFSVGFSYIQLEKQLRPGIEVLCPSAEEEATLLQTYNKEAKRHKIALFVPASGMATRMFKALQAAQEAKKLESEEAKRCFAELRRLPFYELLKSCMQDKGESLENAIESRDYTKIIRYLLTDTGLNYAQTPKWALPFHTYGREVRPCWLEHAYEAQQYAADASGTVRLHATLRSGTSSAFLSECDRQLWRLGEALGIKFAFSYSYQDPRTHSLAVYLDTGKPVRTTEGGYLWRPSGHGALLQNLQAVDASLVFIKNVDNIHHELCHFRNARYKKILGGRALRLLHKVRRLQEALSEADTATLAEGYELLERDFLITHHPVSQKDSPAAQLRYLHKKLNRPFRVCALVRSRASTGGAPFLCRSADGSFAPQIVEPPQVNEADAKQAARFAEAVYLNPVDMACILDDMKERRFELSQFSDTETGFITEKSYQARPILVQELPGLWNGGMSDWNTSFLEVPADTFAPVKQLSDLLSAAHQGTLR